MERFLSSPAVVRSISRKSRITIRCSWYPTRCRPLLTRQQSASLLPLGPPLYSLEPFPFPGPSWVAPLSAGKDPAPCYRIPLTPITRFFKMTTPPFTFLHRVDLWRQLPRTEGRRCRGRFDRTTSVLSLPISFKLKRGGFVYWPLDRFRSMLEFSGANGSTYGRYYL